ALFRSVRWGRAGYQLAREAQEKGLFRPGVDLQRFVEAIASSLAGQRYLADLTSPETDVRARFEACVEVPLEAMASEQWLAQWRGEGGSSMPYNDQSAAWPDDL